MKRSILLITILILCPIPGYAAKCGISPATYYVNFIGGSDTADGTSTSTAWKHAPGDVGGSWHGPQCVLQPGDKVIFKGDVTYHGGIVIGSSGNADSVAGRIIFDGDSGTYVSRWGTGTDKAKIDCDATYKGFSIGNYSYITINNFEIYNGNPDPTNTTAGTLIYGSAAGSSYLTITNNTLHDVGNTSLDDKFAGYGVLLYGANNADVSYNTIYNTPRTGIEFIISGAQSNFNIHHNNITDIVNWGITLIPGSVTGSPGNWNIYNNTIHNIKYFSTPPHENNYAHLNYIWIFGGNTSTRVQIDGINIYNNLLYSDGTAVASSGAIHMEAWNGGFKNVKIYNNVMKNIGGNNNSIYLTLRGAAYGNFENTYVYNNSMQSPSGATGGIALYPAATGNTTYKYTNTYIKNNIFSTGAASPFDITTAIMAGDFVIDYNLYYASGNNFQCNGASKRWADFKTCTGNAETNSRGTDTDPLFTNVSGDNYDLSLQSGSTAIDMGVNLGASYNTDIIGTLRAQGVGWDIGAYEYKGEYERPNAPQSLRIIPSGLP